MPDENVLVRLKQAPQGRYTIERQLGADGMATVYLAHDVKHGRRVAVKVLWPELAAMLGTQQFLNEIKVTANRRTIAQAILASHTEGEAVFRVVVGLRAPLVAHHP